MPAQTAAKRLEFTGPQWLLLCRTVEIPSPEGFGPAVGVSEEDLAAAERELTEMGVLDGDTDDRLNLSVAVNLAIWLTPALLARVEVSIRDSGLRAAYAVRGQLGASLFTLPEGGVELSMFHAAELGGELRRCVPDIPQEMSERSTMSRLVPTAGSAPVYGRVPLAALADSGTVPGFVPGEPGPDGLAVTEAEARVAAELNARTVGVLNCLMVGARTGDGDPPLVGNVVWFATDAGWVGVEPHPDGSGRQLVDLVPVRPEAIGGWLAPYLARILEATDD